MTSWIEPGTGRTYPTAYVAYRRAREAQERFPARHRALGPDVDRYVWQCARVAESEEVDVELTVRPDASPRVRRIIAEILTGIRRGRTADDAIRRVAHRFGLRYGRARAFVTAAIECHVRRQEGPPYIA